MAAVRLFSTAVPAVQCPNENTAFWHEQRVAWGGMPPNHRPFLNGNFLHEILRLVEATRNDAIFRKSCLPNLCWSPWTPNRHLIEVFWNGGGFPLVLYGQIGIQALFFKSDMACRVHEFSTRRSHVLFCTYACQKLIVANYLSSLLVCGD